jgi:hypothetical protein
VKKYNPVIKDFLRYAIDRDPRLWPATKRLLIRAVSHYNVKTGFRRTNANGSTYSCFPTNKYFEFWLDLTSVSVKRCLDEAHESGWLVKDKDGIEQFDIDRLVTVYTLLREKEKTWKELSRKPRKTDMDLARIAEDRKAIEAVYAAEPEREEKKDQAQVRAKELEARKREANDDRTKQNLLEAGADVLEPYERTDEVIPLMAGRVVH